MLKVKDLILKVILIVSAVMLAGTFLVCASDPVTTTLLYKIIYGVLGVIVIGGAYCFLKHINKYLQKSPERLVYLWIFLLFLMLLFVSIIVRNSPTADYEVVYDAVLAMLDGDKVNWQYFSMWPNNYALFWLLYLGGKISRLIGIQDIFYVLVALNSLSTSLSVLCVYKIIEYYAPEKRYLQYFGAILMLLFVPIWAGTQYVYSDSASILYGVSTIYYFLKGKKGRWSWFLLAGMSLGIGILIKPTCCVCVVAFILLELLVNYKKGNWKWYGIMLGTTLLVCTIFSGIKAEAPYHEYDAGSKAPFQFWFALGLLGDGSFSNNVPFAEQCLMAETFEEREYIAVDTIKNEFMNVFNWEHIKAKSRCNFGSGMFGAYLFQYNVGLGYTLFNPFGLYGGHFSLFATVYFWLLLLFSAVSGFVMLFDKKKNVVLLTWMFGFFGIAVFLMLWEANNRQLYNQIPMLALLGCFSIEYLIVKIKSFIKKEEIHG